MLVLFDAGCIAFLLALVLGIPVRNTALRLGLVDQPDGVRKLHGHPIPRVGGVAVALAYCLTLLFLSIAPYHNAGVNVRATLADTFYLFPGAAVILFTGILDDLTGLTPWQKLTGQTVAALLALWGGFGLDTLFGHSLPLWLNIPLTVFWLVACSNAFNLIDGVDGLAAGVGFFAALTMTVAALTTQNLQLALVTAPLAGALLGFLRYNFNPATIFLGDSGSLLLGYLLGCYGAVWSHKSATLLAITAPLMALALPLLEMALSVLRRFLRRQPIAAGDRGHIHHRLIDRGLSPRDAALLLYAVGGALAGLSVLQHLASDRFGGAILVLFCAGSWIGVQHLGYAEFGLAGRLVFGGGMRRMIDVQLRLQELEHAARATETVEQASELMSKWAPEFDCAAVHLEKEAGGGHECEPAARAGCWHLSVPAGGGLRASLYREREPGSHPIAFPAFAGVVERTFRAKLEPRAHDSEHNSNQPEVVRHAAAGI